MAKQSLTPTEAEDGRPPTTVEALDLYRQMLLVRSVELQIETLHKRGRISGSFHSSLGQEACAVGVCAALREADMVTSTHRGHGHAVAKGVPVQGILAELWGRSSGVSGGRGGSMHLHHRESGFLGENAIVAGGLPWAAGAAWVRHRKGSDDIAVGFIGDGGFAQGVTHEVLLMARHWGSPTLIVCENNGLAHSMPSSELFGEPGEIARMVDATGIPSRWVDGRDVVAVATVAQDLVARVRESGRPAFLECEVFRVRPHSLTDPDHRYRPADAGSEWLEANDPIRLLRRKLEVVAGDQVDEMEREVELEVAEAVAAADSDELTPTQAVPKNVYATPELDDCA